MYILLSNLGIVRSLKKEAALSLARMRKEDGAETFVLLNTKTI